MQRFTLLSTTVVFTKYSLNTFCPKIFCLLTFCIGVTPIQNHAIYKQGLHIQMHRYTIQMEADHIAHLCGLKLSTVSWAIMLQGEVLSIFLWVPMPGIITGIHLWRISWIKCRLNETMAVLATFTAMCLVTWSCTQPSGCLISEFVHKELHEWHYKHNNLTIETDILL